jgi:cell division protein FtsB
MQIVKTAFFIFLFFFFFTSLTTNFFEYRKNITFYDSFRKEYEKEKTKNTELKTRILKSSDPNEIEKTIRNKLNLLQEDELVVIMPMPTPTPFIPTPTPMPIYRQWVKTFFF